MLRVIFTLVSGVFLSIAAPRALASQSSAPDSVQRPNGMCAVWVQGPSGALLDSTYNRCALESGAYLFDSPRFSRFPATVGTLNTTLVVVVNPDGTVNLDLTRTASPVVPATLDQDVFKFLERMRFLPGQRGRVVVRSAVPIVLQLRTRDIPMPALVKWSDIRNWQNGPDTLRGTWVAAAPETPMSEAQVDGIHVATVEELVRTRVVIPGNDHGYCIEFAPSDSLRARRLNNQLMNIVNSQGVNAPRTNSPRADAGVVESRSGGREPGRLSHGCTADDSARRITLAPVVRTEDNHVGLSVSGDFLQFYPRTLQGRTWPAWRGECSASVSTTGAQTVHCNIENIYDATEAAAAEREKLSAQYVVAPAGGDSIRIRVIALGLGAAQTDTMFATLPLPPRIADRALYYSGSVCQGMQAFSAPSVRGRYVLFSSDMQGFVSMLRVTTDSAARKFADLSDCPTATTPRLPFTAFLLGDLGMRDTTSITMCYFGCAERHTIDPARHTLAEHAALTFRPANLTQDNWGYVFGFRIDVDSMPAGLTPLAVFYFDGAWRTAYVGKSIGVNAWLFGLSSDTGGGKNSPADAEVRLYFFRR